MTEESAEPGDGPVAAGLPFTVAAPPRALAHLNSRQSARAERLGGRDDRYSKLLARSMKRKVRGDRLHAESALSDDERAELLRLAPGANLRFRAEQTAALQQLRSVLEAADPLLTLALSSYFQVFAQAGSYFEPSEERSEAIVEVVAGLLLTQSPAADGPMPSSVLISEVTALGRTILELSFDANIAAAMSGEPTAPLRSSALTQWMHVRGDSYEEHARVVTFRTFGPMDEWLTATFGFTIAEFYAVADTVVALLERRVNGVVARMMDDLAAMGFRPDQLTGEVGRAALERCDRALGETAEALIFVPEDVASAALPAVTVRAVLERLSVRIGSLDQSVYSGPFERSPLTRTPFVLHDGRYVLAVPGHLVRSPHELFENDLHAKYPKFTKRRADAVDEICVELIAASLPGSESAPNVFYTFDDGDGPERFETDGIITFENHCLIVEGKAGGGLSDQALRGDTTRAGRDLGKGLAAAWAQCARVQRYLESVDRPTFETESGTPVLSVDMSKIDKIMHITPMLHSLGVYAHQIPALQTLNLFPESNARPWPVLVTDLMVIHELSTTPSEFLHYIQWRSTLPIGQGIVATDELDIFGSYMFGEVGRTDLPAGTTLTFANSTTSLDEYYHGRRGDTDPTETPHRVLGELLEGHLYDLAQRRPNRWLAQSFAILDLPLAEAMHITEWLLCEGPRQLATSDWGAAQFGHTLVALARAGTAIASVALELGPPPPAVRRLLIAQAHADGVRIVSAKTLRRAPSP